MRARTILTAEALFAAALLACLTIPVVSQEKKGKLGGEAKPYVNVPDTVSAEFREHLKKLPDPALRPGFPAPDDTDGWQRFHHAREKDPSRRWNAP